jgi:predicted esterase
MNLKQKTDHPSASLIILLLFLFACLTACAQTAPTLPAENSALKKAIENITNDGRINADSAFTLLSHWDQYPAIKEINKWCLFTYNDPVFGTIPLKIYIPANYQNDITSPAVMILHGAVGLSSFKDAYKDTASDEDLFYKYFSENNLIIIRPFADSRAKFDWVVNRFNGRNERYNTNITYQTLVAIIYQLKQVLNIDDSRVFGFGHSDGSDGAFALEVLKPSCFAGFVVYNSMLNTLNDYDIYLRNTGNRPLYLVHSDLDDLRPIQQTRLIVSVLDSLKSPVLYKEYIGYKHYDKHLQIDLPFSYEWMKGISRNPFQKNISWELSDSNYNTCDWVRITKFDTDLANAKWQTKLNTNVYNKRDKVYVNAPYYDLNISAAVEAHYNNNVFELNTSRIKEVELLISPVMVNLQNPVIVKVNGKEVFNKKVMADKPFLLKTFTSAFDRKALWVTSIKIKTE